MQAHHGDAPRYLQAKLRMSQKSEIQTMQAAVDTLTAQLAVLRVNEVRAAAAAAEHRRLAALAAQQAQQVAALESKSSSLAAQVCACLVVCLFVCCLFVCCLLR
jgi:hypothetical protein